jgi:tetratricopeptide (TPR) repeat protein
VREEETAADRTSAVRRELLYYLAGADACDRVLVPARQHVPLDRDIDQDVPVFAGFEEALAWCTSELGCLVAAVDQAVELGFDDVAWKLPVALVYFLRLQRRDTYRYDLSRAAVGAARREGDSWAETWSLICLGGAASDLERHEEALRAFGEALRISRETGEPTWEAVSVYNLGWTLRLQGRFTEALEHQRRALALHEAAGDLRSSSITLTEVAALELALGRSPEAYDAFGLALERARAVDDLPTEAKALHGLGDVSRATARTDLARDWYARAVQVSRRVGDRFGLACSQFELGKLLLTLDLTDEAVETLRKALTLLETLQDPLADEVRRVLEEAGGIPG